MKKANSKEKSVDWKKAEPPKQQTHMQRKSMKTPKGFTKLQKTQQTEVIAPLPWWFSPPGTPPGDAATGISDPMKEREGAPQKYH